MGKTCQQLPLGMLYFMGLSNSKQEVNCTDFIKQVGHIYNIGLPCFGIFTYISIGKMGREGVSKKNIH